MSKDQSRIEKLLQEPVWSTEDREWLLSVLENSEDSELKSIMEIFFSNDLENSTSLDPQISQRLLSCIHERAGIPQKLQKAGMVRMWTIRVAAACIIGIVAFSTYLFIKNSSTEKVIVQRQIKATPHINDVEPGGNKAVLTLADGSTIVLDDALNGSLAQQGNTKVIKLNGKLDYNITGPVSSEMLFNTITTPTGGQYQVELPDGSKVWLNAESSIRFPIAFAGKERRVEVSGEVYFEVAPLSAQDGQKKIPFIVQINTASGEGGRVEVLGTHFNINAYSDESAVKTTLLEGAVNYVKNGTSLVLKPNQQSQLTKNGDVKLLKDVNVERVVAWKNGFFHFDRSDFQTVAKQLTRWYNVEVVFDRRIDDLFYAEIPRNTKLSDVLKALELTGEIKFKINGNKITVVE